MAIHSGTLVELQPVIREFIPRALEDLAGQDVVRVITIPAPCAPLSTFLSAVPREMSFLWNNPPSGVSCAGGGTAHRIEVRGQDRLTQLREQSDALWARTRAVRHPDSPGYFPRLFGGLAFSADNSRRPPWCEFGDGAFTLSRWTYGHAPGGSFLSLAVPCDHDTGPTWRSRLLDELAAILEVLFAHQGSATPPPPAAKAPIPASNLRQLPVPEWEALIRKICGVIASGKFRKIVAARRCEVRLPSDVSDIEVITRLFAETQSTQFAFRRAESSFMGASPELLFLKSAQDLRTQALAGTIRSTSSGSKSSSAQSERLLGSAKDRSEQEFVVAAIRECLAPLCVEVAVAHEPEVLRLPNILHINTPFEARLSPATHATDILEALHPTPAVGGVPGPAAREWIVENELEERGWYTGPMGWLDCRGDAEFAVAIRCGVLTDGHAYLYTGAGIVADSECAAEYEETALKQLPMLRALGVESN